MKRLLVVIVSIILMGFSIRQPKTITLFLVGDSTVANKPYKGSNPEKGWGQVLQLYFNEQVQVENYALNGRSTKSFINEGHWERVKNRIKKGDYVLIEFGHNDEKENSPERYADPKIEFPKLLTTYISDTRARGGVPILATPIVRRSFDERGYLVETHGEYPDAVRKIAQEQKVNLLDMHSKSKELLLRFGPERSKQLFLHFLPREYENKPLGSADDTHLSGTGAFKICDLAIEEIREKIPQLSIYLKN